MGDIFLRADIPHLLNSVLPAGRLADRLRAEQYRKFRGERWLEDLLTAPQITEQARQAAVSVDS